MPYTINGIGTNLCKARGVTPWGDGDSVECLTFFYIPLLPLKAVHTFNFGTGGWTGMGTSSTYRQIPIRWSLGLLFGAFARRWFGILAFIGGMLLFIAGIGWWMYFTEENAAKGVTHLAMAGWMTGIGAVTLLCGLLLMWLMKSFDRRNVDIRYVLGCHPAGSSDPVHWTADLIDSLPGPKAIFNADGYSQAAEEALRNGDWTGAMWAARLCAAIENRDAGERLTDQVLNHTNVQAAIAAVKADVKLWSEQMTAGKGAVQLWPAVAVPTNAAVS